MNIESVYAEMTARFGESFGHTQVRHVYATARTGTMFEKDTPENQKLRVPLGAAWNPFPVNSVNFDPVREKCYVEFMAELRKFKQDMRGEPVTLVLHDADLYGLCFFWKLLEVMVPERLFLIGDGLQPFNPMRDNVFHAIVAGAVEVHENDITLNHALSSANLRLCDPRFRIELCGSLEDAFSIASTLDLPHGYVPLQVYVPSSLGNTCRMPRILVSQNGDPSSEPGVLQPHVVPRTPEDMDLLRNAIETPLRCGYRAYLPLSMETMPIVDIRVNGMNALSVLLQEHLSSAERGSSKIVLNDKVDALSKCAMGLYNSVNALHVLAHNEMCVIMELDEKFAPEAVRPFAMRLINRCFGMVHPNKGTLIVVNPHHLDYHSDDEPFDFKGWWKDVAKRVNTLSNAWKEAPVDYAAGDCERWWFVE